MKASKKITATRQQQYFSTPVKQVPNEAQKWSQQKERFLLSVSVFNSKVTALQSRFNKMVELIPAVHRWLFTCSITDPCLAPCWAVSADQSCSKDSAPLESVTGKQQFGAVTAEQFPLTPMLLLQPAPPEKSSLTSPPFLWVVPSCLLLCTAFLLSAS